MQPAIEYRVIHGYRRAFRRMGSGPAVLLLHGIGDSSATWLDVMPALAERYTVIAPDLLGHGQSDRPRADYGVGAYACGMRDLLDVLGIESASIIGHSLGGGVAMQLAYQFPQKVERIVLVSAGGVGRGVHPVLRIASAPGAEFVLPVAASAPVRAVSKLVARTVQSTGLLSFGNDLEYLLSCYDVLAESAARRAFLRTLRSVVDVRGQVVTMLDRCYLQKGIPTMLIWGDKDQVVPWKHAARAAAAMPEARLEVFEDTGHFPHHSDPQRFISAVLEHLDTTEAAVYDEAEWTAKLRGGPTRRTPAEPDAPAPEVAATPQARPRLRAL